MRSILLTAIIFILGLTCHAQAVGRIYFGDNPMDVPAGKPDHLEFEASKTDLSDNSKEYLQYMLDQYGGSITSKTGAKIIIEPAAVTPGSSREGM